MESFPPFQLEDADGQIQDAGARLVVVTQQSSARATAWRDELTLEGAIVVANPERTSYRALGARRPAPPWLFRPGVKVGLGARAAREPVGWTAAMKGCNAVPTAWSTGTAGSRSCI